jgi:hypothetical protein
MKFKAIINKKFYKEENITKTMKKEMVLLLLVSFIGLTLAENACSLDVTLLNQDPYPAVPGDYVKLVFQVDGIDSPDCNDIAFCLLEDYPIEFNPGETGIRTFKKIDYVKDYENNLLIPYEVRINEDALDGSNPIEISYQSKGDAAVTKTLEIEIDDTHADFEIYVKNYNYATKELTLELLNIEESDVEAVTVEIPKQENIEVKGSSRVIVGDIDSNEYTTADFEATPSDGEITVTISYSDTINVRRTLEKTIQFDSSYFTNRAADQTTTGIGTYIFWLIVIGLIVYWIYRKRKKNQQGKNKK